MRIVKGKVNYIVTDNDERIRADSIDSVFINQPVKENDRCIVVVRVFGNEIGVTHYVTRQKGEKYRNAIMVAAGMKSIVRRVINLFKSEFD